MRTQPTSTLRSSLLMLPTMPFATTPGSTGSARASTSTGSFVDSLLLAKSTEASAGKDTCTTRTGLLAGQPGRGTRPSLSADSVEFRLFRMVYSYVSPSVWRRFALNCKDLVMNLDAVSGCLFFSALQCLS
ncbi:60S ribosomal protein L15-1 [Iris pallida]|uniref:60S ribosomal protein L15-1 n=1 Tax=Iris pallida TaxID=29817 RepID=A0AAX6F0B8_IRIPA|nr:60S ribosomal protein L15-1 [Iris pallida]